MNSRKIIDILKNQGKGEQGVVLVIVLSFVALMVLSTVAFTAILKRDIDLIGHAKSSEQARNIAEAGVNHAIAKMLEVDGFASRANFNGSLDIGTYSVTYTDVGDRHLVTSVGTVSGVSRTVSAEFEYRFPTALLKMFAGGNDVKARVSSDSASVSITGDIHANNDIELRAVGAGTVSITGSATAVGIVQEGSQHNAADSLDANVSINGSANDTATVTEGAERVKYPPFPYDIYKQEAIDGGDYYSGNTTFSNQTLSPSSGVIYVDGNVKINGTCTLNGGLVGDDIDIAGTLTQVKSGDRNFILAKDKDILINEALTVGEAIVYAKRDLRTRAAGTSIDVTGSILAERDMSFWNVQTNVTYVYKLTHPSDLPGTGDKDRIHIVSWTQ